MNQRSKIGITPRTALLLTLPPFLWAGNAVVGRMAGSLIPPMTFNLLRWSIAFLILLPLAGHVLRPQSALWRHWRRFAVLGLLSVGAYNALQYLALHTSTALNVTLVAASMPVWMLGVGAMFFGMPVKRMQVLGAALSIGGVLTVLSRGNWQALKNVQLVTGDLYVVLAVICWAFYSWMLARPQEPVEIRADWAAFLLGQITFGLAWAGLFAGIEWAVTDVSIAWGWPLTAALLFVAAGPAVIAYRCWGAGVTQAGPTVAGFFGNLTPLIAALLSLVFLGEVPHFYHLAAFLLIVAGIVASSRR